MKHFIEEANAIKETVISHRRRLHSFAECGFDLPKTLDLVNDTLQNAGYSPRPCGEGIVCDLVSDIPDAPTVLLRADMDALPIREETRLCFRAENGRMHACGHDMHTAMLLGAALILKKHEGALPCSVRFAFECAEEILSGAREMVDSGVLTGVKAALMLHVVTAVPFPTGTVLLPPDGIAAPAARFFEITVRGKSAHIGEAEQGVDALREAVALYHNMERAREEIGNGLLLSIGKWHAGDAPNIVPAKATLAGSFRARDEEVTKRFEERLSSLCGTVIGGAAADLRLLGGCPPLKNDTECRNRIQAVLARNGIATLQMSESRGNAAEDFAVFAEKCPSVALALAAGERGKGYEYPLHHPGVLFDEDALSRGSAVYALGAIALGEP